MGSLQKLARVDRQTHFETFNFWLKPGFPIQKVQVCDKDLAPKNAIFPSFLHYFFGRFSIYLAPSGAKYCGKGLAAIRKSIGKGLGRFWKKLNFQAVIKSAASAASLDLQGSPRDPPSACRAVARGLPCKSREAALAADLITA